MNLSSGGLFGAIVQKYRQLRLILGDQLNSAHPWFDNQEKDVLYVLMEILPETQYVQHHIQKICGFFLAMRAFAQALQEAGHEVRYFSLDDPENKQSLEGNCHYLMQIHQIDAFAYQEPDEWRLEVQLNDFARSLPRAEMESSHHFLTDRNTLKQWFEGKKNYLMESFYRKMRIKWRILMEDDGQKPLTGQWNYDADNRKKLPPSYTPLPIPGFVRNVEHLLEMLRKMGISYIGNLQPDRFDWPVTRTESLQLLQDFVSNRLPYFGAYQDAMHTKDWLLYHARLSFSLNVKMLHPLEVVQAAIGAWQNTPDRIPFAALEGFIRQIIGWREYVRGIYWAQMPRYGQLNFLEHQAPLPAWYWTGRTHMNCLKHAIGQSLDRAYAHHIQRLMLTGNFALLLGVHPDVVDAWYLGIYMDAVEWVEMPNTRGMSQFADGGIVGTKPYVSSANYIHKMSNYCTHCFYKKDLRVGARACPFNSLYWDFYNRHSEKLASNPRIGMAYRLWDRMSSQEKQEILAQAAFYKQNVDAL